MEPRDLIAAGAVVVRDKGRLVLIVHRPKYDDWSFPKGKLDPGEHVTTTAVREVLEESGVSIRLGRPLPGQRYGIGNGRMKAVHYWVGHPLAGHDVENYLPNAEVDEVRWASWEEAEQVLSYRRDREILAAAKPHGRRTNSVVVLRHAKALTRKEWSDLNDPTAGLGSGLASGSGVSGDRARPLHESGVEQAAQIANLLSAYGVSAVHTSTSTRCLATVLPYVQGEALGLSAHDHLSEEGEDPELIGRLVDDLRGSAESSVVCTHRPVLPAIFAALDIEGAKLAPGEALVAHVRGGDVLAVERHLL